MVVRSLTANPDSLKLKICHIWRRWDDGLCHWVDWIDGLSEVRRFCRRRLILLRRVRDLGFRV